MCSGRWLWTKSVQLLRVEAEGQQRGGHLARLAAQRVGVVEARQGVVVDDAVDRLELVLERDVVADRAQVVAEVDDPRRLDAAEDPVRLECVVGRAGGAGPFGRHGSASVAAPATAMPLLCRCDATGPGRRAPAITARARIPGNEDPCAGARRRAGFVASGAVSRPGFGPIPPLRSPDERAGAAGRRPRRGHGGSRGRPGARPSAGTSSPVDGRPALELVGDRGPRRRARPRGGACPAELLTDAPAHLVASPETRTSIVELMGGDEPARTLIAAALGAGQAGRDREQARARPSRAGARGDRPADRRGAPLRGGGRRRDPGPRAARDASSPANRVAAVRGIVNGTTNYILTAMTDEGRDYDEVLAARPGRGLRRGRSDAATSRATTR